MKLEFNRNSLLSVLSVVASVTPTSTRKTVLQKVLLRVDREKTVLIGTDAEITIQSTVADVGVRRPGEVLLPAKRVGDVLRESKEERGTLEITGNTVLLTLGRGKFNLPTQDASEFPACPIIPEQNFVTVSSGLLKTAIRRTAFATDVASGRYALHGVLFRFANQKLNAVATDSRRLSIMAGVYQAGSDPGWVSSSIVPVKTLALIERAIPDGESPVEIGCTPNLFVCKSDRAQVSSMLLAGAFPAYQDIIPRSHNVSLDLIVSDLLSVLRQAALFTDEETRGVDFWFNEGTLKLSSEAATAGTSELELPISYDGEAIVLRLDPRFFIDFLKTLAPNAAVNLKIVDDGTPVVLSTEDGSTYLINVMSRE